MRQISGPRRLVLNADSHARCAKGSTGTQWRTLLWGGLAVLLSVSMLASVSSAEAEPVCDRHTNEGLDAAQDLADSLNRGQTGCLHDGTYILSDDELKIATPGIELRSAPGERATIRARIYVPKGADQVTIRNLNLDGSVSDLPSPTVNADQTKWIGNDITNHHQGASCLFIGHYDYGIASDTLIRKNRIHDCGRLPRTNYDHGIYLNVARNTTIVANKIYDNADRGIQLRTDVKGTLIKRNIVDGNGVGIIFSGDKGTNASYNTVVNNIISFSEVRHNVESFYPEGTPEGRRNLVRRNCVYGGAYDNGDGGVQAPHVGFVAKRNIKKAPKYVNRQADDFRLRKDSPCKALFN